MSDNAQRAPCTVPPMVRCLIADMAVALSDFEANAWDGDPRRRSDDPLCMKACKLIDQANAVVEANNTICATKPNG